MDGISRNNMSPIFLQYKMNNFNKYDKFDKFSFLNILYALIIIK